MRTLLEYLQTTYCERSGPGPLDEPLNALSSLAFTFAAALAIMRIRRIPSISREARLLPWMLATVAIGSAVYHTYRSPVTFVVDVLPLVAFIIGSIFLVLRKVMGRPSAAAVACIAFVGLQIIVLIFVPNDFLNGTAPHLATLLFILLVIAIIAHRYGSLAWQLLPIVVLYSLASVFRTVDMTVCPLLSTGTHFLWHITGAVTGYFAVRFVSMIEVASQGKLVAI